MMRAFWALFLGLAVLAGVEFRSKPQGERELAGRFPALAQSAAARCRARTGREGDSTHPVRCPRNGHPCQAIQATGR